MKVERVSYPVMTPSAARGVLEAIFWKPEFSWEVQSIAILRPIRYFSILRNEVNSRQSERTARRGRPKAGAMTRQRTEPSGIRSPSVTSPM
jgi:CRISPR-associated protein Cas5d